MTVFAGRRHARPLFACAPHWVPAPAWKHGDPQAVAWSPVCPRLPNAHPREVAAVDFWSFCQERKSLSRSEAATYHPPRSGASLFFSAPPCPRTATMGLRCACLGSGQAICWADQPLHRPHAETTLMSTTTTHHHHLPCTAFGRMTQKRGVAAKHLAMVPRRDVELAA